MFDIGLPMLVLSFRQQFISYIVSTRHIGGGKATEISNGQVKTRLCVRVLKHNHFMWVSIGGKLGQLVLLGLLSDENNLNH